MLKKFSLIVLLLGLMIVQQSIAENVKIAYVDIQRIMNTSKAGEKFKKEMKKTVDIYNKKLGEINKKIADIQKQLESPVLSKQGKEKKKDELRTLQREFFRLQQEAQQKLTEEKLKAEEIIVDQVRKIAQKYAIKHNIDIIFFGGVMAGIIYADDSIDITKDILKLYDAQVK